MIPSGASVIAIVVEGLDLGGGLSLSRLRRVVGVAMASVWWVGKRELLDLQTGCGCAQRERRTSGVAIDEDRLAGSGNEGGNILNFPLD